MSGIHRSIYQLLLPPDTAMTVPDLRAHLRSYPRNSLCASLNTMVMRGQLVRTGTQRKYVYALSQAFREKLESDGLDNVVRERGVRGVYRPWPSKPANAANNKDRKYAVYQALFDAPEGLTLSEAKVNCPDDIKPGFIAYALSEAFTRGHATRTALPYGNAFVWAYTLDAELRESIATLGLKAAVDEAQHAYLTSHRDHSMPTTPQPVWPVFEQRNERPLCTSLGTVLPWLDEEEAPPVIGERYRDALRPRPRDD